MKGSIDSQPAPGKWLKGIWQLKFIPLEDIDYYICETTGVTMYKREMWFIHLWHSVKIHKFAWPLWQLSIWKFEN